MKISANFERSSIIEALCQKLVSLKSFNGAVE